MENKERIFHDPMIGLIRKKDVRSKAGKKLKDEPSLEREKSSIIASPAMRRTKNVKYLSPPLIIRYRKGKMTKIVKILFHNILSPLFVKYLQNAFPDLGNPKLRGRAPH